VTRINPALIDVVLPDETGYPAALAAEDTRDQLCAAAQEAGAIVTDFPKHLWIEPRDWPAVAAENDRNRTWPIDYIDRFTNQGKGNGGYSTHECTCHSLSRVFEAAWNRQRKIPVGPPVANKRLEISAQSASVWVSPLSIYAEANPREWGGASVRQVLKIAADRGFLPDKIQPRDYGFKHTLHGTCGAGGVNQSRGSWVSLSKFPEGWRETAKHLRPLEYIFPESWEQTVCLALHGFAIGVGREGHAVPYVQWIPEDEVMAYTDSYDVIRYDSVSRIKKTVGGAFAIVSTTVPDDYLKPAA
jgi:hypothetical protein